MCRLIPLPLASVLTAELVRFPASNQAMFWVIATTDVQRRYCGALYRSLQSVLRLWLRAYCLNCPVLCCHLPAFRLRLTPR
ncbi:Uncharacterised protein [Vibrio cholerae]|nr:Uncharacterised protein [Vibrio cholerae]